MVTSWNYWRESVVHRGWGVEGASQFFGDSICHGHHVPLHSEIHKHTKEILFEEMNQWISL